MTLRVASSLVVAVSLSSAPARAHAVAPPSEPPATAAPASEPTESSPTEPATTPEPTAEATTPEPTPAAPTETPAAPLEEAPPSGPGTVHIHLESTKTGKPGKPLELFVVTEEMLGGRGPGGGGLSFRRVCGEPCDVAVPRGAEYFVAAGKDTQSRKFTIDRYGDRVHVRARPGSRAATIVGNVLIGVGALLLVSGIGMIVGGELFDRRKLVLAGGGMVGGGLGSILVGIPVELAVGRSRVKEVRPAR